MAGGHRDIDRTDEVIAAMEKGMDEYVEAVFEPTVQRIVSNMRSGKDATGRNWTPLQPSTVAAKGHSTPLYDSGELAKDIEQSSRITDDPAAVFSASLPYAGAHEFGFPEQNIPPRPFLQPGLEYAASITPEMWDDTFDAYVQAVLL